MKSTPTWKLLTIAAAVCAALLSVSATATAGPVNRALTGGILDPYATTLRVVPPRGGMVMVHQNGKAVGWFMQAGIVNVTPNQIYGLTATRGTHVLFNASIVAREGYTQAIWGEDDAPQLTYQPMFPQRQRARARSSRYRSGYGTPTRRTSRVRNDGRARTVNRARTPRRQPATTRPTAAKRSQALGARGQRQLLARLQHAKSDRRRYSVMKRYNKSYRLSASQKRAVVQTFDRADYRRAAERTMGLSERPRIAPR